MGKRILVCGSRNWTDYRTMYDEIMIRHSIHDIGMIIEGGCEGADIMAKKIAIEHQIQVLEMTPEWDKYGKAAGPKRNQKMIDYGKPHLVLAFHNDIEKSKGTKDMVERAKKANIPVDVMSETEWDAVDAENNRAKRLMYCPWCVGDNFTIYGDLDIRVHCSKCNQIIGEWNGTQKTKR